MSVSIADEGKSQINIVLFPCKRTGVYSPVRSGVVTGCDEHRVPLRDGETDEVDRRLFRVGLCEARHKVGQKHGCRIDKLTPSASMIRISCPSIQKKKAENAEVLMSRRR
jgi:hypothetical protein